MWKYDNKYIKFVWCCYSGFFFDILSLNVKMYLWLKLYTVPFFVSGQTYKISKGSNNYCSYCKYSDSLLGTSLAYQPWQWSWMDSIEQSSSLAAHFPPQPEDSPLHSVPWLLCTPLNLLFLSPSVFSPCILYLVSASNVILVLVL